MRCCWKSVLRRNRDGFTVIEMLVVLGITVMLLSMFAAQAGMLRDQVILFREEAQFMQLVLRAKTSSLQSLKVPGTSEIACGYGVHSDEDNTYLLYARRLAAGEDVCPSATLGDDRDKWRYDETKNEFVIIGPSYRVDTRIMLSTGDVVFVPPKPNIPLIQDGETEQLFDLCLTEGEAQFCRQVTVNLVGQVTSGKSE